MVKFPLHINGTEVVKQIMQKRMKRVEDLFLLVFGLITIRIAIPLQVNRLQGDISLYHYRFSQIFTHNFVDICICFFANVKALIHESVVLCSFFGSKRRLFCIIVYIAREVIIRVEFEMKFVHEVLCEQLYIFDGGYFIVIFYSVSQPSSCTICFTTLTSTVEKSDLS